jgi:hypothetical protein
MLQQQKKRKLAPTAFCEHGKDGVKRRRSQCKVCTPAALCVLAAQSGSPTPTGAKRPFADSAQDLAKKGKGKDGKGKK